MAKVQPFKEILTPFDEMYLAMLETIETTVESKTDAELRDLLAAANGPTQTNCGWTMYRVAEHVRDYAVVELRRRAKAREE